jgi:hypothetical protein
MQKQSIRAFAGLTAVAAFTACNANPDHSKDVGRVEVALTATGTDGAHYRLPAGSFVELFAASFDVIETVEGSGDSIAISVPPGSYQAWLYQPDGSISPDWMLEHVDAGGTLLDVVHATLLTALPVTITVTADHTTNLVFSFRIPTGGTVTFDRGTVQVSIEVAQETASSYSFDTVSALTVASRFVGGPSAALLAERLPPVGTTGIQVELGGTVAGDWLEVGGFIEGDLSNMSACAPPGFTIRIATGSAGLQDLMTEVGTGIDPLSLFGAGSLCIQDDGVNNFIRIRASRAGAPTTATFSDLGADQLWFRTILLVQLPHRAYNYANHTLDLGLLMSDTAGGLEILQANVTARQFVDGAIGSTWYSSNMSGTTAFSFDGH